MSELLRPGSGLYQYVDGRFLDVFEHFDGTPESGITEWSHAHATRALITRQRVVVPDPNPQIVKMILHGASVPFLYYRSDQWIDQPYYAPNIFLQPFIGPANEALPNLYGEGTYAVQEGLAEFFLRFYGAR